MSENHKGKRHRVSKETKIKISKNRRGYKHSEEAKKRMSKAQRIRYGLNRKEKTVKGKYVGNYCPEHPRADSCGRVLEHILVWERYHNRSLPTNFIIHHINGIRIDNRPENLLAMGKSKHHTNIEPYRKRIRELEIENQRLRQQNLFDDRN